MSEHDLDGTDRGFELVRAGKKIGQHRKVKALAFAKRVSVVADDMEHPEHRGGPAQVLWNVAVAAPDHVDQKLEIGGVADVLGGLGGGHDGVEGENAGLLVVHRW